MPKTLCDLCHDPGHCCRAFFLTVAVPLGGGPDEAAAALAETIPDAPFVPLERSDLEHSDTVDYWRWTCPALTPLGRCSVYETRPQPCRSFEAGSAGDGLCTMHGVRLTGAELAELGLPQSAFGKLAETLDGFVNAARRALQGETR